MPGLTTLSFYSSLSHAQSAWLLELFPSSSSSWSGLFWLILLSPAPPLSHPTPCICTFPPYLDTDGFVVVVFGRGVGCRLCISHVHVSFCTFLATCDDACILLEFAFVPGAGEKPLSWCEWGEMLPAREWT